MRINGWYVGQRVFTIIDGEPTRTATITRLTKTRVVLNDGQWYQIDGRLPRSRRSPWHSSRIQPSTDEMERKYTVNLTRQRLANYAWTDLSDDAILLVWEAVRNAEKRWVTLITGCAKKEV